MLEPNFEEADGLGKSLINLLFPFLIISSDWGHAKDFVEAMWHMHSVRDFFSRPLFIIIFRVKILFSGPYSILTGLTKVLNFSFFNYF